MIRLGLHSVTNQIPFAPGTPSVEASWAFNAYAGLGLREGVERVLAQKRRGVRPILRVDYAPGQTCQYFIVEVGSVRRLPGDAGHGRFTVQRAEPEGRGRFCGGARRRLHGRVYRPVSRCARLGVRDACARVGGRGADAASVQRAVAVGGVFLPAAVPSERAPTVFWCTATRTRASRIRPRDGGSRTTSSRHGTSACATSRPAGTSRSSSPNGTAAPAA